MIYIITGIAVLMIIGSIMANAKKKMNAKQNSREEIHKIQSARSVEYFDYCRRKSLDVAKMNGQSTFEPAEKKENILESHSWLDKKQRLESEKKSIDSEYALSGETKAKDIIIEETITKKLTTEELPNKTRKSYISEETNESKSKGNDFEFYAADIFKSNGIKIKDWNQGTISPTGAMGENALNPDFFVIQKAGKMNLEYWVECKWREKLFNDTFIIKRYQFKRYKEIQKNSRRKIFIFLGLGGTPYNPEKGFLIPLFLMKFDVLSSEELKLYLLENPESDFARCIRNHFYTHVFNRGKDTAENLDTVT